MLIYNGLTRSVTRYRVQSWNWRGISREDRILFRVRLPGGGGAERWVHEHCTELANRGYEITLYTPQPAKISETFDYDVFGVKELVKGRGWTAWTPTVIRSVRELGTDVFHLSGPTPCELLLVRELSRSGIPTVLTYHADYHSRLGRLYNSVATPLLYNLYSEIFVQSSRDRNHLRSQGVEARKLMMLHWNGIDPSWVSMGRDLEPRASEVLFVGRLDRGHSYKGLDLLLNAINYSRRTLRIPLTLTICGDGEKRVHYENLVTRMGLEGCTFLGEVDDRTLHSVYGRANIFALPSSSTAEGFGKVALEAIAVGLPVVVSNRAGIAELVGKYAGGLVIDPFDVDQFARALVTLSQDVSLRRACVEGGHQMIESENLVRGHSFALILKAYHQCTEKSQVDPSKHSGFMR